MTTKSTIHAQTTANRTMIADLLDGLDEAQWEADTLCEGWSVRHVAAHLLQPMLIGFGRFFWASVRFRGDTEATIDHLTRRLARRSPQDLVALLRLHAADKISPPRVGPMGPFAETCIHLRDIARPLDLDTDVPVEQWQVLLDYLSSATAAAALVPAGRLDGLTLSATDAPWTGGAGTVVSGPAEALAMAATGRTAALADLHGPGVTVLRRRVSASPAPRR